MDKKDAGEEVGYAETVPEEPDCRLPVFRECGKGTCLFGGTDQGAIRAGRDGAR